MYPFELDYYYDQSAGKDVDVYVLDTGLDPYLSTLYPGRFVSGDTFTSNEILPQVRLELFSFPLWPFVRKIGCWDARSFPNQDSVQGVPTADIDRTTTDTALTSLA
jgi:hypothetical protein